MLKTAVVKIESDVDYQHFERLIAERVAGINYPLFTTDASGLWKAYLNGIPGESKYGQCNCGADRTGPTAEAHTPGCPATVLVHSGPRQHYNCNACRKFIENYGGLVSIQAGQCWPLLWNAEGPGNFFTTSQAMLWDEVAKAKVTGAFYSNDETWGIPLTGNWSHLSGRNPKVFWNPLKTAHQMMAEKLQDYITLKQGLNDPLAAAVQAVRVLESYQMDRSEKTLGVAKWLLELHDALTGAGKGRARDNIIWLAVAKAPVGFCHIRSTMISTLLDDIVAGKPFEMIKKAWEAKMHPVRYQRPTALKEGNIEVANKIIEKLGAEKSLKRRFATIGDVIQRLKVFTARSVLQDGAPNTRFEEWLWMSSAVQEPSKPKGGAFDHLRPTGSSKAEIKEVNWETFKLKVLTAAAKIEVFLTPLPLSLFGLTTAVHDDAPPIILWDGGERLEEDHVHRNPVSWFFNTHGAWPLEVGLNPGWHEVNGVCAPPCAWQKDDPAWSMYCKDVFFIIDKARWQDKAGVALFPEVLKGTYREARAAIEAYSNKAQLAGAEEGNANGIALGKGLLVRATNLAGGVTTYKLIY